MSKDESLTDYELMKILFTDAPKIGMFPSSSIWTIENLEKLRIWLMERRYRMLLKSEYYTPGRKDITFIERAIIREEVEKEMLDTVNEKPNYEWRPDPSSYKRYEI